MVKMAATLFRPVAFFQSTIWFKKGGPGNLSQAVLPQRGKTLRVCGQLAPEQYI